MGHRQILSPRTRFFLILGILALGLISPVRTLEAHSGSQFYNPAHEFTHFLDDKEMTPEKIIGSLGEPHSKVRKLAGWEYWYYDSIEFNNKPIENTYVKFMPFKYGQYISPRIYRRMQNSFLNTLFFPVLPFLALPYPFSAIFLFIAMGFCLYGIIRFRWKAKFFSLYLTVGILLALNGVIF